MNNLLQGLQRLDTLAFLWLHVTKALPYRRSVRWVSHTGDGHCYGIAILALFALEPRFGNQLLTASLLAFGLNVSLYLLLKNVIKRDRPAASIQSYQAWIQPSDQFSFPSGHTAAAFVFASLVTFYYPLFALPLYLWAGMIGASRVLLGVHYPSDIAAGAVLGLASSWVGLKGQPLIASWVGGL